MPKSRMKQLEERAREIEIPYGSKMYMKIPCPGCNYRETEWIDKGNSRKCKRCGYEENKWF